MGRYFEVHPVHLRGNVFQRFNYLFTLCQEVQRILAGKPQQHGESMVNMHFPIVYRMSRLASQVFSHVLLSTSVLKGEGADYSNA